MTRLSERREKPLNALALEPHRVANFSKLLTRSIRVRLLVTNPNISREILRILQVITL